ncbi:MAG TPA: D-alanyl-D-alanine carboxypeptidase family protein [Opitutaceae bacterium]|nr:D-alanyl-D-alanine carboxypeptidase family protein [Opitutaceae bacterium]
MIFSRRVFISLIVAVLPFAATAATKTRAKPTRPAEADNATAYKGAIVVDAASGAVLFEDRADVVSPPASMTKLMTFAVLQDKIAAGALRLDTPVTVNRDEAKFAMKADSTSVWLKEKETFSVEELVYAMMIQSANDAALVLARAAAGSEPAFVELMNQKAKELGMTHTVFRTPHGFTRGKVDLSLTDVTTPRDFALLCRMLVTKTDVLKYTSVKTRPFGTGQRTQLVEMQNHNHLLGHVAGVDGLKTGYTEGAGYCLSATAERNRHRVIVVVMGSFGPNGQKDLGHTRDLKAAEFIERGFSAVPPGSPAFVAEKSSSSATNPDSPMTAAPHVVGGSAATLSSPPEKITVPGLTR